MTAFLVDAQLPPALARWLVANGHEAEHVVDLGLASATDNEIWDYAIAQERVILTKDEDFSARRLLAVAGPPVVWIRRGNTTRRELLTWFEPLLPGVLAALESGDQLIEIV